MRERGLSFKEALNSAIRAGAAPSAAEPFRTPTFGMGKPRVSLEKALWLAAGTPFTLLPADA